MRVPKRNAGLITKALGLGIFAKGPRFWAEVHRERKNGIFNRDNCAKGGKAGGKVTGRANKELRRGICNRDVQSRAGKKGAASQKAKGLGMFADGVLSGCAKERWADPVWREMQRWRIREGMKRKKSGKPK